MPYSIRELQELGYMGAGNAEHPNPDGFVSAIKRGGASMVGGVGEIYAKLTGDEEYDNALTRFDDRVQQNNPSEINSLEDVWDNPGLAVRVAAGSAVPFLATGLGGKAVGLAGRALGASRVARAGEMLNSMAAQTAIAGLPTYRQVGEAQRESGQEPNDLLQLASAVGVGAIETKFGAQRMFGIGTGGSTRGVRDVVRGFGGTPLRTGINTFARSALEEGAEELLQNPLEQYASYQDPTTQESLEQTALGGVMGALGGAAFGLVGGGRAGMRHQQLRGDLRRDQFVAPGASTPTDLLQGLDRVEQYNQVEADRAAQKDFDWVPEHVYRGQERDISQEDPEAYAYQQEQVVEEKKQALRDTLTAKGVRADKIEGVVALAFPAAKAPKVTTYTEEQQAAYDAMPDTMSEKLKRRAVKRLFGTETATSTPAAMTPHLGKVATRNLAQVDLEEAAGTLTQNEAASIRSMWENSPKTQAAAHAIKRNVFDITNAKKEIKNGNVGQSVRPGGTENVQAQAVPGQEAGVAPAEAPPAAAAQEPQAVQVAVPQTPPPPKPASKEELPAYKAAMIPWLTSTLAPAELQALEVVSGVTQESAGDEEAVTSSLRVAAKKLGVSHETVRQRAAAAEEKIAAAAQVAGFDLDTAHQILGMQSSADVMDQSPVSIAQAAQSGLNVQRGARGETAVADAGQELGGEAGLVGEFGDAAEFDEGFRPEGQAAAAPDAAVDAEDAGFDVTAKDHQGHPIRPVDFEDAALEWRENIDGQDIPKALLTQFTKLWIANEDGVLNDKTFHEHVRALRQQAGELRRVPEVAAGVESEEQAEVVGEAGAPGQPAQAATRKAPKTGVPEKVAKAKKAPKAALAKQEMLIPEIDLWEQAWDEVAAAADVATWKALTESQRAHLMSAGSDEDLQARAVNAIVAELKKGADIEPYENPVASTKPVEVKKKKGRKIVRQSQGETTGSSSVDGLRGQLQKYFFSAKGLDRKVAVFQNRAALPTHLRNKEGLDDTTKAFTYQGKAYLLADNISKEEALGVLLHEVGVHLGMKGLLGEKNFQKLAGQIHKWADGVGTKESELAKKALARVVNVSAGLETSDDVSHELIAYFVEEAVNAGVNPAAAHLTQGPIVPWFKALWHAISEALRKFGFGKMSALTPEDVVNLAYGAAHLQFGTTAKADPGTRFSQAASFGLDPIAFTNDTAANMIERVKTTAADLSKKALNAVLFLHDLIDVGVKKGLTTAKGFGDLMGEKDQIRNIHEQKIDRIMERASKLSDQPLVEKFIRDSTLEQKWGYGDKADAAFVSRFKALSSEGQAVVKDIFKVGEDDYAELQRLTNLDINNEYDALIKRYPQNTARYNRERARDLKRFGRAMPKMEGPYAPLKRFGEHVVVAKSQAYVDAEAAGDDTLMLKLIEDKTTPHYVVQFFETAGSAAAYAKQIQSRFPSVVAANRQQNFRQVDELPWSGIAKIKAKIEDSPDRKYKESMERLVTNLYLQMLAESSARKSEMQRKGVLGSGDMFRAFAAHGRSNAHYLAALTKNKEISQQISAMRNEAHDAPGDIRDGATRVYNEIMARYDQSLDYKETPWVDKALRTSSIWMLLSSPAYYMTNATQTYMVAMPVLGGRYGGRAFTEINKAYGDVTKFVGQMGTELDLNKLPITAAEKTMLLDLQTKGKLDISMASDLGRWASGAADQGVVGRTLQKLYSASTKVEALNRITTALAAFRLSGDAQYAGDMVDQTQGNYAGSNAPRFFRANGGMKLITQFRKYQLIQISLMGRLIHDSFKGSSKEEKAVARRALAWLFAQQAVFTGIKGLPIPAVLYMLAAALGGDDDKDWERNLRKWIGDDDVATLLIRGVPAWMGLDVSGRIGMGNAFSVLPFSDIEFSKKGYKEAVVGASGAFIGGMGGQLADGIDKMGKGKYYKGVEALMPRGLRDAMTGYRIATEGVTTGRGDVVLAPDEISAFDGAMKAVGLPTTTYTDFQTSRGDLYELGAHFKERDTAVKDAYARAAKEHDAENMAAARNAWKALQESKTRWREEMSRRGFGDKKLLEDIKPQPMSTLFKAPATLRKREKPWAQRVPAQA